MVCGRPESSIRWEKTQPRRKDGSGWDALERSPYNFASSIRASACGWSVIVSDPLAMGRV
jgi:hypothetical protein